MSYNVAIIAGLLYHTISQTVTYYILHIIYSIYRIPLLHQFLKILQLVGSHGGIGKSAIINHMGINLKGLK